MPPETKKPTHAKSVLKMYSKATLRYPGLLLVAVLGAFGMQSANVITPLYLKRLIDSLSTGSPSDEVVQALFLILAVYAGLQVLNWTSRRLQVFALSRISIRVMTDLINDAFSRLVKQNHEFFLSSFTGTLTRRVTRFGAAYERVLDTVIENFLPTLLFAIGSIAVLYNRNPWLGVALAVWVVVFISIQVVMTKWRQPLREARTAADSKMTGTLSDVISNHSAVTLFAAAGFERKNFSQVVDGWRVATVRAWNSNNAIQAVQEALVVLIQIGLIGMGIIFWQKGLLTAGDFLLIQIYIIGLVNSVWNIGNNLRQIYEAFADASEMIEIMDLAPAVQDAPNAVPLVTTRGKIDFKDVDFDYQNERPILKGLNLEIDGGQKIGLVGPSGAGKSTVTKLLLRLYDASRGSVSIDEQDIRTVTQESLRSAISFVPQESVLFHRTLRENILYGRLGASEEDIIAAAKAAHCHEFIAALPQGYDTYVGERGVKLSGGERQRVAIARAILKNAPILVLDEATSSLDSESEALIQDALAKLMEGKTVIAIAHRLSTIMKMDRIVVMENGAAILSGTHDELLAQESNLYKKLWEIQAGSFIADDE